MYYKFWGKDIKKRAVGLILPRRPVYDSGSFCVSVRQRTVGAYLAGQDLLIVLVVLPK